MKNKLILAFGLLFPALTGLAQDDLMDLLEEENQQQSRIENVQGTFMATRIINGHSVETRDNGSLVFIIAHRFGPVSSGARDLFGLDEANMRFGLEYGIADRIDIAIGRSSFLKTYDGFFKVKLLNQSSVAKKMPVSLIGLANIAINTSESSTFIFEDVEFSDRVAYAFQFMAARKINSKLSLQITPTLVHRNTVTSNQDNDIWAVGLGGRYKITRRTSFNAEYFYQINRQEGFYNAVAFGFDIETGGHVFQLHVTNARSMIEQGFIAETIDNFWDGDIRLGFNISRYFNLRPNRGKI